MMNSEKAWYWLAAAILAAGLTSDYRAGGAGWAHELAGRAQALVASSTHASRYLAVAQIMLGARPSSAAIPRTPVASACLSPSAYRAIARQRSMAHLEAAQLRRASIQVRNSLLLERVKHFRIYAYRGQSCPGAACDLAVNLTSAAE
jgi:hypothetical protein